MIGRIPSVLCFGDSNTWGSDPSTGERFAPDVRWPGVLRRELGNGWQVVEEGLPGRTAAAHNPGAPHLTALPYLLPALESHAPLDVVLIMLGTNDPQVRFGLSAGVIADDVLGLAELALRSRCGPGGTPPRVVVVAPPPLREMPDPFLDAVYGPAGPETSRELTRLLPHAAAFLGDGCEFFDAGTVAQFSEVDGLHLDPAGHEALGRALAPVVRGDGA